MTQKELLYVEDAISHECTLVKICEETINMLDDDNLINFMENQKQTHIQMKENLLNMLEAKVNG